MRIPSLDGLRAVSISFVLISHISQNLESSPAMILLNHLGRLGVTIFFVISGYLITGILLKSELNLKNFYYRRFLRIFPPYYVFLLVMLILSLSGIISIPTPDFLATFSYTLNYFWTGDWWLGHCWSLAVEEQFYLILPVGMWVMGKKNAYWFPIIAVILCPLFRLSYITPTSWVEFAYFETVADSLAIGCLLSYFGERIRTESKLFYFVPFVIIGISFLLGFPKFYDKKIYVGLLVPIQNLLIALVVLWCVRKEFKILNWKPVIFIGTLSYSLYLWQQPFMMPKWEFPVLLKLVFIFLAALGSYYLVEKPFLKLRQNYQ